MESGINDVVWEFGVSRVIVWCWIKCLVEEGGCISVLVFWKWGCLIGIILIFGKVEVVIEEYFCCYFLWWECLSLLCIVIEI